MAPSSVSKCRVVSLRAGRAFLLSFEESTQYNRSTGLVPSSLEGASNTRTLSVLNSRSFLSCTFHTWRDNQDRGGCPISIGFLLSANTSASPRQSPWRSHLCLRLYELAQLVLLPLLKLSLSIISCSRGRDPRFSHGNHCSGTESSRKGWEFQNNLTLRCWILSWYFQRSHTSQCLSK